jgi:hypothetical protein
VSRFRFIQEHITSSLTGKIGAGKAENSLATLADPHQIRRFVDEEAGASHGAALHVHFVP